MSETRPIGPAFAAFAATAAAYWLALMAALWLPLRLLGNGLGALRVIGGLLMPGLLVVLGFRRRGRGLAVHAGLVALAFAGTLAESVGKDLLLPAVLRADASAHALIRMMTYAYAGAALHAAVQNAVVAFRSSPGRPS